MTKDEEYKVFRFDALVQENKDLRLDVCRYTSKIEDLEEEIQILVGFLDDKDRILLDKNKVD